jgi:hypothetical protein
MSMEKGSIHRILKEPKLNTGNSNKTEIVSVNDILPNVLWTRGFLLT